MFIRGWASDCIAVPIQRYLSDHCGCAELNPSSIALSGLELGLGESRIELLV